MITIWGSSFFFFFFFPTALPCTVCARFDLEECRLVCCELKRGQQETPFAVTRVEQILSLKIMNRGIPDGNKDPFNHADGGSAVVV